MSLPEYNVIIDIGDGIQRPLKLRISDGGFSFFTPHRPDTDEGRLAAEALQTLSDVLKHNNIVHRALTIKSEKTEKSSMIDRICFDKPLPAPAHRGW